MNRSRTDSKNSQSKQTFITPQQKLLFAFFHAEEQRKQKETEIQAHKAKAEETAKETLNQAKESAESNRQKENEALNIAKVEMSEALNVYQKLESDLSDFTRPQHQLSMIYDPIKRLDKIKGKLEEAQAHFLLKTLEGNNSAYACASNAKQLGGNILKKIEDYRQTKSNASSSIQKVRSELHRLESLKAAKYIKLGLETLHNQLNLAEQHFQEDTILDYRQTIELSKGVSSKIGELTSLANQRKSEHDRLIHALPSIIAYGVGYAFLGSIVGLPVGCIMSAVTQDWSGMIAGAMLGAIVGFPYGFHKKIKDENV